MSARGATISTNSRRTPSTAAGNSDQTRTREDSRGSSPCPRSAATAAAASHDIKRSNAITPELDSKICTATTRNSAIAASAAAHDYDLHVASAHWRSVRSGSGGQQSFRRSCKCRSKLTIPMHGAVLFESVCINCWRDWLPSAATIWAFVRKELARYNRCDCATRAQCRKQG